MQNPDQYEIYWNDSFEKKLFKATAISAFLENGADVPIEHIKKAISFYMTAKNPDNDTPDSTVMIGKALNLALIKKKELPEIVVDTYEKLGCIFSAARFAREVGLEKRAKKLYIQAIQNCEKAQKYVYHGLHGWIWQYSEERQMRNLIQEAGVGAEIGINHFLKTKEPWYAANVAEEAGLFKEALALYEKIGWYHEAGRAAEKAGLLDKAREYKSLDQLAVRA